MDESAPLLDNTQNHEIEIIDIQAGTTSSRSTLLNLLNLLLGIGLLSLPFAFSTLGWILSLVLLTVFCALSCYTTCMIASFHTKSLDSVAKDAFGRNGGICVSVLICMELTAAAVAMTILVADSVVAMIGSSGGWDTKHIKIAFAVLATPTCLLGMGKLSWMSAVGILCFANLMLIVVGDGALGVEGACWYKPQETVLYFTDFKQAAMAVGLLFVGLDCHSMVPSIQRAMINPHEFKWASTCAYSIVWVVYMIFGAAGYLMFGAGVRPEITQSVAAVTEFKGVLTTLTLGLIAVSIFSKYSLVLKPVFRLFEEKVQTGSFASIAVRVAISIFVVLASIVFPSFSHAMGLLGCLFSFSVAVIVPLTCALKLKVGNTREHMILLVFGISMAVVGLYGVA